MKINDTVTYEDFGGYRRTVIVTDVYKDIKNGQPGFNGTILSSTNVHDHTGDGCWGYTYQVIS